MPTIGGRLTGEHVLVTGGSGFIGRSLVPALISAGARVRVADLRPFPDPAVPVVVGDVCDPAVQASLVTADLTGIVHLAAVTSVLGSLQDPIGTYNINVDATATLLETARRLGVRRFLMASTSAVVGDIGNVVMHEDLPLQPLTPYGATKAAAEMLLCGYASAYGMTTTSLRLTNVYGPHMERKDSLVPRLLRAAKHGSTVQVYGDGRQLRDLVHVDDVVAGVLIAWTRGHLGPLIIGSGRSVSVLDVIASVERVVGVSIRREHQPARTGEMPAVIASVERARALGYTPTTDLDRNIATVWSDVSHWADS